MRGVKKCLVNSRTPKPVALSNHKKSKGKFVIDQLTENISFWADLSAAAEYQDP